MEADSLQQWEGKKGRKDEERDRSNAIRETKALQTALDNCWFVAFFFSFFCSFFFFLPLPPSLLTLPPRYCMESPKFLKHMLISLGDKTYLTLPVGGGLVSGHTRLMAMEHGVCCKEMEEETYAEICKFKHSLIRMFKVIYINMYLCLLSKWKKTKLIPNPLPPHNSNKKKKSFS